MPSYLPEAVVVDGNAPGVILAVLTGGGCEQIRGAYDAHGRERLEAAVPEDPEGPGASLDARSIQSMTFLSADGTLKPRNPGSLRWSPWNGGMSPYCVPSSLLPQARHLAVDKGLSLSGFLTLLLQEQIDLLQEGPRPGTRGHAA